MSNQRYPDAFYNEKVKFEYLKKFAEEHRTPREVMFRKSYELEEELNKDLYDFELKDIEELLRRTKPTTINSVRAQFSLMESYIQWCIKRGYRLSESPIKDLDDEYKRQFIYEKKGKFITKEQLVKEIRLLKNPQDQIIPILLFYGISGTGSNELANIKISDVDLENRLISVSDIDGRPRKVRFDERFVSIFDKAIKQKVYFKNNGKFVSTRGKGTAQLGETGYLIKPIKTHNKVFGKIRHNVIANRIEIFKEATNRPNITPLSLQQSGHLYRAYQLLEQNGKLDKPEFQQIAKDFCFKESKTGSNWIRLKDYATEEVVKELYNN